MGKHLLEIGDGSAWTFVNGAWHDGPGKALVVPEDIIRQDGRGIQGHHYAFLRDRVYDDLRISFRFRLFPHSDVGIILRARDPSRFYLLHFPDCGQASRAQHFWAAFSRMDDSGYLRIIKMELVRRIPSTNRLWHKAEVRVSGGSLSARIGETGLFEASDAGFRGAGRIGLYLFGRAEIREVSIEGVELQANPWDDGRLPATNWFNPCPDTEYGKWQRPRQLVRTPTGDLLLSYTVQERPYSGRVTHLTARSADNGRTWSRPQPVELPGGPGRDGRGVIHVFPDGVLRMMIPGEGTYSLAESHDGGRTWSSPEPVAIAPPPQGLKQIHLGPQAFLNLKDGSTVMFGYGSHSSTDPGASIYTWGSHHCQAFACRSTDNGRTWTPWVNVDGTLDGQDRPVDGNLDLTEVCGVQVGDGRIFALIRPIYSPWMWETWSSDGGRSWTPCVRGPFPGYATPNMLRTASGRVIVAHRLPGCTIHTSQDDGRTWDNGTLIDSAIWAMGSMLEVEPDTVLYVYWDSFESLMRAQFIRVTADGPFPITREEAL